MTCKYDGFADSEHSETFEKFDLLRRSAFSESALPVRSAYSVERLKDQQIHGHVTLLKSERSTLAGIAAEYL